MHFQSLIINTKLHELAALTELIQLECQLPAFEFAPHNPDFLVIAREGNTISIDDVKSLTSWAALKPFQSACKVILIMQAERMTPEAQNSLLKLIEEPPTATLLALHTLNTMALLPTIRSRTRVVSRMQPPLASETLIEPSPKSDGVEQFVAGGVLEKMQVIDNLLKEEVQREEIVAFLEQTQEKILQDKAIRPTDSLLNMLKSLKQAAIGIRTGTNTRLTLESLAISIKEQT